MSPNYQFLDLPFSCTPPRAVIFLLLFTALDGLFAIANQKEIFLTDVILSCVCTVGPWPMAEPANNMNKL